MRTALGETAASEPPGGLFSGMLIPLLTLALDSLTPAPRVRIALDDSLAPEVSFVALGAELRLDNGRSAAGVGRTTSEVRLTKRTDALTPVLVARTTSGQRIASVVVEIVNATDTLRVHLFGATVVSASLSFPAPSPDGEEQRLAQDVAIGQLESEVDDAHRQLGETESLAKQRMVAGSELARIREKTRVLDLRLAAARRQRALLVEKLARAGVPTESITLRAERVEVR